MSPEYRRHLILLLLFAAAVLAAGLGLRDPWPADEPRFALIARDMVESGNWLFPLVGGVVYPDKPPLFFWLVAALYALTNSLRSAFLLPGVLAGVGTIFLVTDLARRLWSPTTAIWSGAILLAIVQFPLQMKTGQIDGLLCFWTTLGLYGFSRHLLIGPDWRWYAIGGVASGLGIITKGVGFLPYLIFIPYLFARARHWPVLRHASRDWRWTLAPAGTLLAVGIWLVPMLIATGSGADPDLVWYRENILFHQTVTRYADSWGHIKPVWYLFTNAIPWLWLPVSFILPWLVPAWRHDLRSRSAPVLLLGAWILLVLLFFSLSDGKRSLYIFPAAPALALIAGLHAEKLVRRAGVQRMLVALPAVFATGLIVVAVYALMNPHQAEQWTNDVVTLLKTAASMVVIGMIMMATIFICRRRHVLIGFAMAMTAFWVGASLLIAPSLDSTRSGRGLIQSVERQVGPNEEIAFAGWPEQFILQWHTPLTHFGYRRNDQQGEVVDSVRWLSASPERRLLLPENWLEGCFDRREVVAVGRAHRRSWVIADGSSILDSCRPNPAESPQMLVRYSPPAAVSTVARVSAARTAIIGSSK